MAIMVDDEGVVTVTCSRCKRFMFKTELRHFEAWCPCGWYTAYDADKHKRWGGRRERGK